MRNAICRLGLALGAALLAAPAAFAQSDALDRSVLPIPSRRSPFIPNLTPATLSRHRASR
jgi:hypothetical protein